MTDELATNPRADTAEEWAAPRVYRYRKHIRWGQYAIPIFQALLFVVMWAAVAIMLPPMPIAFPLEMLLMTILITALPHLVGCGFTWWFFYRMAGITVTLEDDALVYRNRGGEKRLYYNQMTRLGFPSVRYAGGWVSISTAEHTVRLTVVVEGIGTLLQELKAILDTRGRSDCYDEDAMFRFLKTAEFSDQSWERLYESFWVFLLAGLTVAVVGGVLGYMAKPQVVVVIVCAYLAVWWPTGVYMITEYIFGRHLVKLADQAAFTCPPRDRMLERAVYRKASAWGAASFLVVSKIAFLLA